MHRIALAAVLASAAMLVPAAVAGAAPSTTSSKTGGIAPPATSHVLPRATGGTAPAPRASQIPSPAAATPPRPTTSDPTRTTTPGGAPPAAPVVDDVPPQYRAIYKAAATAASIDWRILAAIGKNETDHGRSKAPGVASGLNYARCCSGPMQICQVKACGNVWQAYAADGNGDGRRSVYDPADAILAAASIVSGLVRTLGPDPSVVLAGYNAGPGNVRKYHGVPPFKETQNYVAKGLRYIAALR